MISGSPTKVEVPASVAGVPAAAHPGDVKHRWQKYFERKSLSNGKHPSIAMANLKDCRIDPRTRKLRRSAVKRVAVLPFRKSTYDGISEHDLV